MKAIIHLLNGNHLTSNLLLLLQPIRPHKFPILLWLVLDNQLKNLLLKSSPSSNTVGHHGSSPRALGSQNSMIATSEVTLPTIQPSDCSSPSGPSSAPHELASSLPLLKTRPSVIFTDAGVIITPPSSPLCTHVYSVENQDPPPPSDIWLAQSSPKTNLLAREKIIHLLALPAVHHSRPVIPKTYKKHPPQTKSSPQKHLLSPNPFACLSNLFSDLSASPSLPSFQSTFPDVGSFLETGMTINQFFLYVRKHIFFGMSEVLMNLINIQTFGGGLLLTILV